MLAVADCTGHGVPGAFMSMIGISLLNDITLRNKVHSPASILKEMNALIRKILKQEADGANQDGMDILVCTWEKNDDNTFKVTVCGAKRPLYYSSPEGIQTVKGINKSIGGRSRGKQKEFEDYEFTVPKGTKLFLTSDGFVDQPGIQRRKISTQKLIKLLDKLQTKSIDEIGQHLNTFLDNHQGQAAQRDDITIVGVEL